MAINTKEFIKVTRKDGGMPVICLATNKLHYLSVGAKVEEPTEEELREALGLPQSEEKPGVEETTEKPKRRAQKRN